MKHAARHIAMSFRSQRAQTQPWRSGPYMLRSCMKTLNSLHMNQAGVFLESGLTDWQTKGQSDISWFAVNSASAE